MSEYRVTITHKEEGWEIYVVDGGFLRGPDLPTLLAQLPVRLAAIRAATEENERWYRENVARQRADLAAWAAKDTYVHRREDE